MMPRIPLGLLLQRVRPGSGGSALRGGPGPPPAGRVGGLRGSPAAVLEECLPQNSQIVKNNSGGFCLTFALKDFFPPAENCAAAGKVSGGAGRGGGQGCVQGSGSAPFLGHAPCGLGSSIRSGTGGARWEHALLPCSPGHVSGAPRTTGWTEAGVRGRGLFSTASRPVGGVEAAEPPRPARSAFESVFVQVLSAGKNVPGPPTWGRDRAGQWRVPPGGLAQGKAGVGPRGLSGSLQSPGGAFGGGVLRAPPGE